MDSGGKAIREASLNAKGAEKLQYNIERQFNTEADAKEFVVKLLTNQDINLVHYVLEDNVAGTKLMGTVKTTGDTLATIAGAGICGILGTIRGRGTSPNLRAEEEKTDARSAARPSGRSPKHTDTPGEVTESVLTITNLIVTGSDDEKLIKNFQAQNIGYYAG